MVILEREAQDNCNGPPRKKPRGRILRYPANMTAQVGCRTQDPYGMRDEGFGRGFTWTQAVDRGGIKLGICWADSSPEAVRRVHLVQHRCHASANAAAKILRPKDKS